MNFNTHYFNEEKVDEKISVGSVAKAAVKGIGRSIANVARGATGRTKTITFEPGWLKIMKPVDLATYKDLINKYANWKTQKSKLGPKKNFTITDNRDGILGEFSKDRFEEILTKHDPAMKDIVQDAEIPMRMHVYIINNGGKAIFMDLPMSDDGKKRKYAIGLDNKAERAFRQIHGMPFQDYELITGQTSQTNNTEDKPKSATDAGLLKFKYKVPENKYNEMIPKGPIKLAASYEYSKSLLDMFEDEVLEAKKSDALEIDGKKAVTTKNGEWFRLTATNKKVVGSPILTFTDNLIAINSKGEKDNALQDELNKEIEREKEEKQNKETETEPKKEVGTGDNKEGTLYNDLKDELNPKYPPTEVKPTKITKNGWRFILNNGGTIFIYTTTDGKRLIGFDDKSKKIVDTKDLIKKYNLEISNETPETAESPE